MNDGANRAAEAALRRVFGFEHFRGVQRDVVERVLRGLSTLVRVAARMPVARAARSWSCISAINGEMTTQVPGSIVAGS